MTDSIRILVPASPERFDGVRDFARQLGAALGSARRVELVTTEADAVPPPGARVLRSWRAFDVRTPGVIIVNYLPTAWLRAETRALLGVLKDFRAAGGKVIVVVHEYQIDSDGSLRRHAARVAFRRLARAFARRADALVATHGLVVRRLRDDGLDRVARVALVPIGSGIPADDNAVRQRGDVVPGRVVVFGQPAFMDAAAVQSVTAALDAARQPPLRWICRDARELRDWLSQAGVAESRVTVMAGLTAQGVSDELGAAELAFAPIADGVSTRRSTIAAFLQHGLPVVGVRGEATDDLLEESGAFALTARGDATRISALVQHLLSNEPARLEMSSAGRRFFEGHLAWPRIARQYLELAS